MLPIITVFNKEHSYSTHILLPIRINIEFFHTPLVFFSYSYSSTEALFFCSSFFSHPWFVALHHPVLSAHHLPWFYITILSLSQNSPIPTWLIIFHLSASASVLPLVSLYWLASFNTPDAKSHPKMSIIPLLHRYCLKIGFFALIHFGMKKILLNLTSFLLLLVVGDSFV